jgi:hypothetical protein
VVPARIFSRRFLAFPALLLCAVCYAGESAVVIVYQPIITESEADPKGFTILPIPFWWHNAHGGHRYPYFAITHPNQLSTDAPRSELVDDRNLLSSAGILIAGAMEDGTVYVRFENLRRPRLANEDVTDDDIAEAAFECIRRVAHDTKSRPKLVVSGKTGEEAKWKKWQKHFEQHDPAKPFIRPK